MMYNLYFEFSRKRNASFLNLTLEACSKAYAITRLIGSRSRKFLHAYMLLALVIANLEGNVRAIELAGFLANRVRALSNKARKKNNSNSGDADHALNSIDIMSYFVPGMMSCSSVRQEGKGVYEKMASNPGRTEGPIRYFSFAANEGRFDQGDLIWH